MNKNWNQIAQAGNEQLRLLLISAQGEIAAGLARGFPQYFLSEGEQQQLPGKEQLIGVVKEAKRRDEVLQIMKDLGIPYQQFGYRGHCRGQVGGISKREGGYRSGQGDPLDYYKRSVQCSGDELEYKDAKWVVVWNGYSSGDAYTASVHTLVIIPVAALTN